MGFGIVLVGYIFILFDFNLNTFNLLPNVVGWILVVLGMQEVLRTLNNSHLKNAQKMSYVLVVLIGLEFMTRNVTFLTNTFFTSESWFGRGYLFLYQTVVMAAVIYFMYELCKGIEVEARNRENEELAVKSMKVFKIYAIFTGATGFITLMVLLMAKETHVNFDLGAGGMGFFLLFAIALIYLAYHVFSLLNQSNKFFLNHKNA